MASLQCVLFTGISKETVKQNATANYNMKVHKASERWLDDVIYLSISQTSFTNDQGRHTHFKTHVMYVIQYDVKCNFTLSSYEIQ
jgi:nitrous oxidase accessory protein NosD